MHARCDGEEGKRGAGRGGPAARGERPGEGGPKSHKEPGTAWRIQIEIAGISPAEQGIRCSEPVQPICISKLDVQFDGMWPRAALWFFHMSCHIDS